MTEADLNTFIELLSHRKGGGNHTEVAQAIRFMESQGWKITPPAKA